MKLWDSFKRKLFGEKTPPDWPPQFAAWHVRRASEGYRDWLPYPPPDGKPIQLRRLEWGTKSVITTVRLTSNYLNVNRLYWRLWNGKFDGLAYYQTESED